MHVEERRQAYTDAFTASCQASNRTRYKTHSSRKLFFTKSQTKADKAWFGLAAWIGFESNFVVNFVQP